MVDAATFIDPVVPVESERAAGRLREEGHALDAPLVRRVGHPPDEPVRVGGQPRPAHRRRPPQGARAPGRGAAGPRRRRRRVPGRSTGPTPGGSSPRVAAVAKAPGRVLHAACGDGWLVRRIVAAGGRRLRRRPARPPGRRRRSWARSTCAARRWRSTCESVAAAGLGGRRAQRDGRRAWRAASAPSSSPRWGPGSRPGGTLVIHSVEPTRPGRPTDAPPEADLAPGRPLRPEAWCRLLEQSGYEATAHAGPGGADFMVTAVRAPVTAAVRATRTVSAAAGRPVAVHQFIAALNPHDATGTHTLKLRDALRGAGWRSEIFAEAIHDDLAGAGLQALDVPRARDRGRRGRLPVHDVVGGGGVPGRARRPPDPRLPQLHPARVLRGVGAGERARGPRRRRTSWRYSRPGTPRPGQEPIQRARSCGAPAAAAPRWSRCWPTTAG